MKVNQYKHSFFRVRDKMSRIKYCSWIYRKTWVLNDFELLK